ncbi:MAG: hypothetical protein H6556_23790 [Lewinellaceae bacterium]|nr:hypothetical protein [Lewinellaceae bacterium]
MKKTKLYQLLERLDGRELPWLDKFLASPYFNSNPWPQRLWSCLRAAHPRYDTLPKEAIFEQLCPGRPFDAKFLNDRYSELSRLVEAFFFQQEFRREPPLQRRARRSAYRNRGLYLQFSQETRRQAAALLGLPYRSPRVLAEVLEAFEELYTHPESKSHSDEGAEISRAMEELDQYFVFLKLKYGSDQLARRLTFRATVDGRLLDAALREAPALEPQHPAIGAYRRLVSLFREECPDEPYQETKKHFFSLRAVLPADEQAFILAKLVTLAYLGLNQGRQQYLHELSELYHYGDKNGLFIFYGAISDATFLNVCTVASQTGHFAWAQQFIQDNQQYLPVIAARDAVALGQATILFAQEDFTGAYHHLNEVFRKQSPYKLRVYSLYVRCVLGMHLENPVYEETLRDALNAFGQYIRRHKGLTAHRKKEYLNFNKAVRKIALLRSQAWHSRRARSALLDWVEGQELLALGAWLRKLLESPG